MIVGSSPAGDMDVCCKCCALSGTGLCDGLITGREESYRLWCVVCDLETLRMRRPWPALGSSAIRGKNSAIMSVDLSIYHSSSGTYSYSPGPLLLPLPLPLPLSQPTTHHFHVSFNVNKPCLMGGFQGGGDQMCQYQQS